MLRYEKYSYRPHFIDYQYRQHGLSSNAFSDSLEGYIGPRDKKPMSSMNAHYRLNIRTMDEGVECKNEISLEYLCSEYMLKSECESACGVGTTDGSCHWLHENR